MTGSVLLQNLDNQIEDENKSVNFEESSYRRLRLSMYILLGPFVMSTILE